MNNKPFAYYIGVAVAWIFWIAVAACVSGVVIKIASTFLKWLF